MLKGVINHNILLRMKNKINDTIFDLIMYDNCQTIYCIIC